jgi:hypothetical protein
MLYGCLHSFCALFSLMNVSDAMKRCQESMVKCHESLNTKDEKAVCDKSEEICEQATYSCNPDLLENPPAEWF